jgi:hypothetical protein
MFDFLSQLKNRASLFSIKQWMIGLGAILIVFSFLWMWNQRSATHLSVATVDITGIVQQFIQSQTTLNLPNNQLQQRVNAFGSQLEAALQEVAKTKHMILMPREAVIAGCGDVTSLVQHRLQVLQNANQASNS